MDLGELLRVSEVVPEKVICCNLNCRELGVYANCYLHTNVNCPIFIEWYDSLNSTKKIYERGKED